ncbi:helix-turn-helix domain-containing protein [Arthrobacter sp. HY1533]|uniref:helix-turn-helix domain-containing protein n=1 Tax=Arthrobacter sp. HY1533 TaxID=2970919 RepID=UPI0022B9FC72|nr:helix-turn-helix domain-containing protein [Arthrobacter sp. HY1533]
MRSVQSAPASRALRPFVRAFAQRTLSGILESQPMPAFLETVVHFDFGDPINVQLPNGLCQPSLPMSLVGPHTYSVTGLQFEGDIDSFAIFLEPTALWPLFGVPTSQVAETHFDSRDVLGSSLAALWNVLAETPSFAGRTQLAEVFLLRQLDLCWRAPTAASVAATLLAQCGGRITVTDLAWHMNVCVRELERSFIRELGVTPKRFARVARFQAALDAKVRCPEKSWLDIAVNAGYHDQMHLVHEFETFCGLPPTATMGRLGDSRPAALASSHG